MQGHVYHWKHGWIPLTHVAALQKAHGSKTGAAKIEKHHGIAHEGAKAAKAGTPARVRSLPPGDSFKGVHSEHVMGERVTVRKGKEWGTIHTEINGHLVNVGSGTTNAHAVRHLDSTRATVEHAKANPASYTNGAGEHSYGMKLSSAVPSGKDFRSMTPAQKIKAAEIMHGTGSAQHRAAKKRFSK